MEHLELSSPIDVFNDDERTQPIDTFLNIDIELRGNKKS